jgi:hypothetical protein
MAKDDGKTNDERTNDGKNDTVKLALAWLAVGLPLAWGVVMTLKKAVALFVAA